MWGAAAVFVAAWLMMSRIDRRPFRSLGFERGPALRETLIGLALGAGMIAAAVGSMWVGGWARLGSIGPFSGVTLASLGGAVLFNAVTQEVLFRGYVLQSVESVSSVNVALLVSSVLFTLLHAGAIVEGGVLSGVNLFAAGLLLGLAYTATRNLWLPVGLHFSWNFLQGPVLGISVSGVALDSGLELVRLDGPRLLTGGAFGLEGGLVGTAVTVLAALALILRFPSSLTPHRGHWAG